MSENELKPPERNLEQEQVMSSFVVYMSRITREDLVGSTVKEQVDKFFNPPKEETTDEVDEQTESS